MQEGRQGVGRQGVEGVKGRDLLEDELVGPEVVRAHVLHLPHVGKGGERRRGGRRGEGWKGLGRGRKERMDGRLWRVSGSDASPGAWGRPVPPKAAP